MRQWLNRLKLKTGCYQKILFSAAEFQLREFGKFHKTFIFSYLTKGSNKLQCYFTLFWKGFPETNNLAYRDHSLVVKKIKCFKYGPSSIFFLNIPFVTFRIIATSKTFFRHYTRGQ
jgi:hypothetical protein